MELVDKNHHPSTATTTSADRRRAITGASVGNLVEWFDFAVYGYLAAYIGQVFFPSDNPTVSLLASFAAFASAFVFRPLGGFYFGPLADRIGRKRTLVIVISVMSISTIAVGLLPGYDAIGVFAPALLVLARCVQGFSAGGEFGGGAAFMAEYARPHRRGFATSFLELTVMLAYMLSILVVLALTTLLSEEAMSTWGWRIPFILGGVLGLVGFWIRTRIDDTPAFQEIEQAGETAAAPIRETFAQQWRPMLRLAGMTFIQWIGVYIVLIYIQTFLIQEGGHTTLQASVSTLLTLLVAAVLIPALGRLSDSIGRKPILLTSSVAAALLSYPLFALVGGDSFGLAVVGHVALGAIVAGFLSTTIAALTELFPTRVRVGAFSISYGVTGALIGGTAPLVATALIASTGNRMIPALMLIVAGIVSAATVAGMKETAGDPLP